MKDRMVSLLGTVGLVIALAIVALPATKLFAGAGHTCAPSACLTNGDGTCKDGSLQTGTCVPSVAGKSCSPCTATAVGGCKCTTQ